MPDVWQSKIVPLEGGLITNQPALIQGAKAPGSLIRAVNFEPSVSGGYRRVSGYSKYSSTAVTNTGAVLGVWVFNGGVVAARGSDIFYGGGTTWAKISSDVRAGVTKYRGAIYDWASPTLVMVDNVHAAATWDGTTYTLLNGAGSPPSPSCVVEYRGTLFFGQGNLLYFCAPYTATDFATAHGAGTVNAGYPIVALATWRDDLYIMTSSTILKLTGSSSADYKVVPVIKDLGCIAADSVQEVGGNLLFLSPDGVRTISGTASIGDINFSSATAAIQTKINVALGYTNISTVVVRGKSQYRLFYNNSSVADSDASGLLGGISNVQVSYLGSSISWEWMELQGIRPYCCHSYYTSTTEKVVHGGYDGYVYLQESGTSFNGSNVNYVFQTAYDPYEDPRVRKTLWRANLYIDAEGPATFSFTPKFDYDTTNTMQPIPKTISMGAGGYAVFDDATSVFDTVSFDALPAPSVLVNLQGSGYNNSLLVYGSDTQSCFTIKTVTVEYSLGGRV